ncbi:MAG: TolB family protein [Gemmataceae bacterium]
MSVALRKMSLPVFVFFLLAGCSAGVREDRTIHFGSDGEQVAFQHGRGGLYIAETESAEPTKIYQPDADTIAVSAPLWSPTDKRLIFTTAKSADTRDKSRDGLPAEPDPAGRLHFARPTLYTCWLRSEPKIGQPLNVPLFTVACGHPGYVAANLAVRWHADGQHILYVKQDDNGQYGLHELDLQTNASHRVFPHIGNDLVFDWTPDQSHLVCVISDKNDASSTKGIWIGKPGADTWWRVPDSCDLGRLDLEDLRAARPVWTSEGSRFAFVGKREGKDKQSAVYSLHLGDLAARTVTTIHRGEKTIRDLHWRPDGQRLGFLCGEPTGAFHLLDVENDDERTLGSQEFCNFAGWDTNGEQLAFVARQPLPHDPATSWAFLLLPDVRARDRVLIASDADPARTKTVFSGIQVTFPHWSPKEAKLSLWATFRPPYRSWLSHLLDLSADEQDPLRGLTLRPGDPALVLDPATGERHWKAINAGEKIQVGHYHLLHRDYAEAWKWYEQAAVGVPNADDRSPRQFVRRFVQGRDSLFFQAFCLDKLGRADEAWNKRRQFEETFLPEPPDAKPPLANQPTPFGAADIQPSPEQLRHWRDLYVAEVFLSLDALEEGERYFRASLKAATSDADRLSKALVLTQFLLLRDKHEEYAELATDTVLPLLLRAWKPRTQPNNNQQPANLILAYSDGLSLLPLFSPEFLARLSEKQVRSLVPRWRKQQAAADDDVKRLGLDLFFAAAAQRLGRSDEQQAAILRIAANPARQEILGDKGVAELIDSVRGAPKVIAELHDMLR